MSKENLCPGCGRPYAGPRIEFFNQYECVYVHQLTGEEPGIFRVDCLDPVLEITVTKSFTATDFKIIGRNEITVYPMTPLGGYVKSFEAGNSATLVLNRKFNWAK